MSDYDVRSPADVLLIIRLVTALIHALEAWDEEGLADNSRIAFAREVLRHTEHGGAFKPPVIGD